MKEGTYTFTAQSIAETNGLSAATCRYRLNKLVKLRIVRIARVDEEYGQKIYEGRFPFSFLWDHQDELACPNNERPFLCPSSIKAHNPFKLKNATDWRNRYEELFN